ncbi:type IX secretion system membrane protein PorP/SprF [Flavobacterium oncorhynchi]|uniref:PorP/SprF family type IX secretion system membrane protein n=1 Tax=Flavobacterium oncorhynchi TaxID=728056 RepID=UPI003519F70A
MIQIKNKIIALFFFFGVCATLQAQQESLYTQYMYNTGMFNPAYAGSKKNLSITGAYRAQWVGIEGAPATINVSLDSPVAERVGLGLNILNDKIGPSSQSDIAANLSYYIPVGEEYTLYFGLRGAVELLNIDFTKLNSEVPQDRSLVNIDNRISPNAGVGVYFESDYSYLGVSVPSLLQTSYYKSSETSMAKEKQHFYFMAGYVFELSYNLKFKPAALVKVVSSSPTQIDLSANFLFNEKFTIGAGYRFDASVISGMAAFQVSDKILVGYAYDHNSSVLGRFTSGSHELFLQFTIINFTKTHRANFRFF